MKHIFWKIGIVIILLSSANITYAAVQQVTLSPSTTSQLHNASFAITANYSVDDSNYSLLGLGVRIHFDSSALTFSSWSNVFSTSQAGSDDTTVYADSSNYDSDATTDSYIQVAWADPFGQAWPGSGPVDLFDINFTVNGSAATGTTPINISFSSNASGAGYTASGTGATVTVVPTHSLTMAVSPTSSGTTNPAAGSTSSLTEGAQSISATPATGYYFVNWTSSTGATFTDATAASTSVTLDADMTVTANFAALPTAGFTQSATTISRNGSVTFTNTSSDASSYSWDFGDGTTPSTATSPSHTFSVAGTYTVTLTATNAGGSDTQTSTVTVNPLQFSLTMAANPTSAGTTSPAIGTATTTEGAVSITANPALGYGFTNWTSSTGATFGDANSRQTTVNLDQNMTVTANFAALAEYTITLESSPTATGTVSIESSDVTAAGPNTYYDGTVVSIKATPAGGYQFSNWIGNVANTSSATTAITMDSDQTVTAVFVVSMDDPPEAQSLSPTVITNDVANVVTVTGINFNANYTYEFYMTWVRDYIPAAPCEYGTTQLTATRLSTTAFKVTVPSGTLRGVYNIAVCVAGQNAIKAGNVLELRIAEPAVTSAEQDDIEDAVTAAATNVSNVSTVLPTYDYTADDPAPLTSADLTTLGLSTLATFATVVDFKIELVNNAPQVTATTKDPIIPSSTGTLPIQYTLKSSIDQDATPIDENKAVEIKVTLPKGIAITGTNGAAYTKAISPPAQEFVSDAIQNSFGGSAVQFSMGSSEETIHFNAPIFVDFVVTLPSGLNVPRFFLLNTTTNALTLAGVNGVSPMGDPIFIGGSVIEETDMGTEITYTIGGLFDHMSTYVVGDYTAGSGGDSSSIACFISSLASGIQSVPGIVTILMMIGSIIGVAAWRKKKD